MKIPTQLKDSNFRFLKLRKKAKEPSSTQIEWQKINYCFDNPELLKHLELGGNYGIIGGFGNLVIVDSDSPEITEICETKLPTTFTIKTGSPEPYKKHYYFTTEVPLKPIRLSKEKVGDLGDIRSIGQYVVGPNSEHPSGGKYEVIKDITITRVATNQIREVFKEFTDPTAVSEFKEYPIITTKRSSDFIRNCRVPDYCINHKLNPNTSKNWQLFPYLVDILYNREVTQDVYVALCKRQEHNVGAIKGWVKKAHEGKLMKCDCKKMQDYLDRFHPNLKEKICGGCPLYKPKKPQEFLFEIFNKMTNFLDIAEEFIKKYPIYYDDSKIWWIWNFQKYKWEMVDEIDILNAVDNKTQNPNVDPKIKNEILEALKRKGRLNKPKKAKPSWVQFKNKIHDIETNEIFDATPKYFITNPIDWELGESEDAPALDILFTSWVGEEHKQELYEILAFCLVPDYFIHRLFCLIGSGSNGKTTFLNILGKFVGEENVVSTSLYMLLKARFEGSKLLKKLVCLMGETSFELITNTDYLKKLTGQDLIRAEFKGKNCFDFRNYAKLIMATNSLPPTSDKTIGFYRRWKIIDFINIFPEETDVLFNVSDEEYKNLSLKCLNIAKNLWKHRKFTNEGDFERRKEIYENKSNPLTKFIRDKYIKNTNKEVFFQDFFESFNNYLEERGHRILSAVAISRQLKAEGYDIKTLTKKSKNGRFVIGIGEKVNEMNGMNQYPTHFLHVRNE